MNRITYVTIAGKQYPLNFSTRAAKKVAEKYGDITEIGAMFEKDKVVEMLDEVIWLLSILIAEGAAYERIVNGDDSVKPIPYEDLEVILGLADLQGLQADIMGAVHAGQQTTVEVEPEKNEKTTQGTTPLSGTTTSGDAAGSKPQK